MLTLISGNLLLCKDFAEANCAGEGASGSDLESRVSSESFFLMQLQYLDIENVIENVAEEPDCDKKNALDDLNPVAK